MRAEFGIFNNSGELVFAVDSAGGVLFQNRAAEKFFGKLKTLSKIKKYFECSACMISGDRLNTTVIDLLLASKENFHADCTFQAQNGDYYELSLDSVRHDDFFLLMFKNLSERIKTEQRLAEYDKLFDKYQKLLISSDKLNKLKEYAQQQALKSALINRIFAKIRTSEDTGELIGTVISEIHELLGAYKTYYATAGKTFFKVKQVNPDSYSADIGRKILFDETSSKFITDFKIRDSVCLKEGFETTELLRKGTHRVIIPITDGKKLFGVIVVLTVQSDVVKANTELLQTVSEQLAGAILRTKLTEDIKKQNNKLRKTLKELETTQLQLINSEKLASVGQLVAGVAHEINTPLASINSNNEIITRLSQKGMLLSNIDMIKEINAVDAEAVKRISGIVKSLKKFIRLDEAELQPADINNELDLTLQLISHETKNKITVIKDYAQLPTVNCYVNMLNQVFMNVLVNACQSIKDKGEIKIKTRCNSSALTVSVKDNGCGIKDKDRTEVFKAGYTTKGIGVGTGLGLAICSKIIKKHKGSISFKSKEGIGTEFIIKIPCRKQ